MEIGPSHEPEEQHLLLRAGEADRQGYGSVPRAGDSDVEDPELALDTFTCGAGGEERGEEEKEGEGVQSRRAAVDLRKCIFLSMGIPSAMSLPREFKRNCSEYQGTKMTLVINMTSLLLQFCYQVFSTSCSSYKD